MVKTDQIPVVSQAKSLVQLASGDKMGAIRTQRIFINECPVVSQVKSAIQMKNGDQLGAMITQAKFFNAQKENVECIINGTPIIGHAKAIAHYAMGHPIEGNKALKASTRSAGVLTGATLGMVVGGPTGAIAGGIAGGIYVDGITTQIESGITSEYRPNGMFYVLDQIKNKEIKAGELFDTAVGLTMDGFAGKHSTEFWKGGKAQTEKIIPYNKVTIAGKSSLIKQGLPIPEGTKSISIFQVKKGSQQTSLTRNPPLLSTQKQGQLKDSIMIQLSKPPVGKPDGEDENMKVFKLIGEIKKLQKKWKGGESKGKL